jgi:hypothetical protein
MNNRPRAHVGLSLLCGLALVGCGGDGGGGNGGRGGTTGSSGRGGTTGAAGTTGGRGGTTGAGGSGGGVAGTTGSAGSGGGGAGTTGTAGSGGGSAGAGGGSAGASGAGGRGGGGGSGGTTGAGGSAGTTGAGGGAGAAGAGGRGGGSGGAGTGGGAAGGGGASAGSSGSGGGAGAAGAGGTSGAGGAAACNALVDDAPGIPEQQVSGTPPAMTGGTIPDGTYVMSERLDYAGTCNCITHNKLVISGNAITSITRTEPDPARRLSGTVSTTGNMISINITCPAVMSLQAQYTVLSGGGVTALRILNGAQLETWVAGSCNTIAHSGSNIAITQVAEATPTAAGGTLVDGTYVLTARQIYTGVGGATGPTGEMRRQTLVISNAASGTATVHSIQSRNGGADSRETLTAMPSGTTFAMTRVCPPPSASGAFMYTATGSTLLTIDNNRVDTWMRQ